MHKFASRVRGQMIFDLVLFSLAILVLVQNRHLMSEVSGEDQATGSVVAKKVATIVAAGVDGDLRSFPLTHSRQKVLVIGFSFECPACRASKLRWSELSSALEQRGDWRVLWLARDPVDVAKSSWNTFGLSEGRVLADPPHRVYAQLGLGVVPRMVVILPGGRVDRVWTGALSTNQWKEVSRYFGVHIGSSAL